MTRRLAALFFMFALAACATAPPPAPPPSMAAQIEILKTRLFVLVEDQRRQLNEAAKPLVLDPELMTAAQTHSEDMASKGSFDVENPDGNVAVNTLLRDPKFQGFVGENAAAQYFTPSAGFDPDQIARGFLAIWMMSPNHRSNILDRRFDRTGIGIAVNGNAIYAAEVFATDLGLAPPP